MPASDSEALDRLREHLAARRPVRQQGATERLIELVQGAIRGTLPEDR